MSLLVLRQLGTGHVVVIDYDRPCPEPKAGEQAPWKVSEKLARTQDRDGKVPPWIVKAVLTGNGRKFVESLNPEQRTLLPEFVEEIFDPKGRRFSFRP